MVDQAEPSPNMTWYYLFKSPNIILLSFENNWLMCVLKHPEFVSMYNFK